MKKVLVYSNRKQDPQFWDVSTPELHAGAMLELFRCLDKSWEVYNDLDEEPEQKALYKAAKTGDATAAE